MDARKFHIPCGVILDPPRSDAWDDVLRWTLSVMNQADPDMGTIASFLAHYLKVGVMSPRRALCATKIVDRVTDAWFDGSLECQKPVGTRRPSLFVVGEDLE